MIDLDAMSKAELKTLFANIAPDVEAARAVKGSRERAEATWVVREQAELYDVIKKRLGADGQIPAVTTGVTLPPVSQPKKRRGRPPKNR